MENKSFEAEFPKNSYEKEFNQLVDFLKEGNAVQVVGIPGVGKSTFCGLLTYNHGIRLAHFKDQQPHFVRVNFAELRNRPIAEVTKFLFLQLIDSLEKQTLEDYAIKITEIFKNALSYNDELVLFAEFKKAISYLTLENNIHIILLFEKFDEYIPSVTSELFTNLRSLRNLAKFNFSVVFSLRRPLEELLEPGLFADFYEFVAGHTIYLPIFEKTILGFVTAHLEKVTGKKVEATHLKTILTLTGGHGTLTRLCIEACLNEPGNKYNYTEFFLAQKSIQKSLRDIWYTLTPAEQQHLQKMQTPEQPEDTHEYLEKAHLINHNQLQIPLLADFIKQFAPVTEAHFYFNPQTNSIKLGEQTISDMLTKAEFRLLSYLLEHANEIISREQIISVVWEENKTYAGVTEQALDQLIFRLRKKIENQPTSPKHLLTVKGRGLRFIP